jgi:hypothetical protein
MPCRLGVDVESTFTELLLIDEKDGATFSTKSAVDTRRSSNCRA